MKMKDRKKQHSKWMFVILGVLFVANVIFAVLLAQNMKELKRLKAQFAETSSVQENIPEAIDIFLPETVYAVNGVTMEIYNTQVTSLGKGIEKYNVCWNCEVGENLERKFSVAADETNIGSYVLVMEIYDNALELVAQKECILKIVEGNEEKKEVANAVSSITEVPEECLEQVKISVDTEYNGALDELKLEGVEQLQDVVYSVLCDF